MLNKKEFNSDSLKNALMEAAEYFNSDRENINYEIITEKTKYFGHKNRKIYINAWITDAIEEPDLSSFIKKLIKNLKFDLKFTIEEQKGFIRVDFKGDDYKLLLYQNGKLLNSIQYLLNRIYSDLLCKKIYCESKGFRKKREKELSALAHKFAKDVIKSGKIKKLEELNPFERRIVHMTINRYSELESESIGDNFLKIIEIKRKNGK